MRLIFLGHCSYFTIAHFAKAIKQNLENVSITVADPVKPGGGELTDEEKQVFDEIIKLPSKRNIKLANKDKAASLKEIIKNKNKINFLIRSIFLLRWNSVKNYINGNAENIIYENLLIDQLKNYDVFHFHYLAPEFLTPLKFIKKDKKVLLTFWGSDLYQITGSENYNIQLEAIERADLVTINSVEMKETFLSKFGRMFQSKVRFADFGLNKKKLCQLSEKNNQNTMSDFRKKNNIPEDKIILIIGYSGSSKQRHVEILKIIKGLSEEILNKIFVIIPMTYGLQFEDKNYLQKVIEECSMAGFKSKIITDFMSEEQLIEFTISGQIKLNLRDTDAMNAAMLESLFTGCIVVNGAWLPYGKLRRLGIHYEEIDTLNDLKSLIPCLVENFEQEKLKTKNNQTLVNKNFSYAYTIHDWIKIYKELTIN